LSAIGNLLFQSYGNLADTGDSLAIATNRAAGLAAVHREAALLRGETERLVRTADYGAVASRRLQFERQIDAALRLDGLVDRNSLTAIREDLSELNVQFARAKNASRDDIGTVVGAMDPTLREIEMRAKLARDREQRSAYAISASLAEARASAQRLLLALAGLAFAIGAVLAASLRRTVRSNFANAVTALHAELEERRAAEIALRHGEERFRSLVQNSSDVVTIIDDEGVVHYQSPAAGRVFGYAPDHMVGRDLRGILHPDDAPRFSGILAQWQDIPGVAAPVQWSMRHHTGKWLPCETVANNMLDDPNIHGFVLNTRDISERKSLQEQLTYWAYHDALTGLANRTLFHDRVEHALARSRRHLAPVAVLFLDLDDFKRVNDSLGHPAGDELLVQVAERVRACLRPEDTPARLGGDEFGILIEDCTDMTAPARVSDRIVEALRAPFHVQAKDLFITASIGIAISESADDSVEDLLRNADVAMYSVKNDHDAHYAIFRPDLHSALLDRLELEADLRRALDREEFVLHYQPIVDLQTDEMTGVEALVRWNHPDRGMLLPESFVPLAEATGLVLRLDHWVIRRACRQAGEWRRAFPNRPLIVSVNVSARQLQDPKLFDEVTDAIATYDADPRSLIFEITESLLMLDAESTIQKLSALKSIGVRLAIDDFGTGYSSLSYLRRFPVDMLKVDKAFVDGVGTGVEETAFMGAVEKLARTLRLTTIIEGIERPEQVAQLKQLGCAMGQGFFFSPAVPRDQIETMLERETEATGTASQLG